MVATDQRVERRTWSPLPYSRVLRFRKPWSPSDYANVSRPRDEGSLEVDSMAYTPRPFSNYNMLPGSWHLACEVETLPVSQTSDSPPKFRNPPETSCLLIQDLRLLQRVKIRKVAFRTFHDDTNSFWNILHWYGGQKNKARDPCFLSNWPGSEFVNRS